MLTVSFNVASLAQDNRIWLPYVIEVILKNVGKSTNNNHRKKHNKALTVIMICKKDKRLPHSLPSSPHMYSYNSQKNMCLVLTNHQ